MASKAFENEFSKSLELLSTEQQNKAITYVKALLKRTKSINQLTNYAPICRPV